MRSRSDFWLLIGAMTLMLAIILVALLTGHADASESGRWKGLRIAEPNDCSDAYRDGEYDDYDRDKWLPRLLLYAPYSDHRVLERDRNEYQLEHIVARREAHVSGLCAPEKAKLRKKFINDPFNMALADGPVNKSKGDRDPAGWLPDGRGEGSTLTSKANLKWFCQRVIDVKLDYGLSIDRAEKEALEACLE